MRIPCLVSVLGFVLLAGCSKAPTEAEPPKLPVPDTSAKQPVPDSAKAGKSVKTRVEKQTRLGMLPPDVPEIKPRKLTPYNPAGTGPPNLVCFSPDGKTVLNAFAAGFEPTVYAWDAETGKETVKMKHAKVAILAIAISPDGKTVAAAGEDGVIRLWDPATGRERDVFEQKTPVEALAFSPDGKTLAAAGGYRTLLYEVATGKFIQRLEAQFSDLQCVAFSPDGKVLGAGGRLAVGDAVYLWEMATGKVDPVQARRPEAVLRCLQSSGKCDSLTFSPDGKTLAAATTGRVLHWDVATRKDVALGGDIATDPEDGALNATSVAFSPDGKTLAVGSMRGMVYFRDVATGKYKAYGESHFVGQFPDRSGVKVGSLAFSPDGKTLVSAGQDGTVQLWDVPMAK